MKQFSLITLLAVFGLSINVNAQNLNFLWAKQMGGTTTDEGYSIAVDASGNVYTTGAFTGTADFNPSSDPNTGTYNLTAGNYDIFVSKLDASGNFVWAKQFGGPFADYGYSIALDANGNVYTTGYFQGTVDFDPGPGIYNLTSAGSEDVFISKLDVNGNFVWAKRLGGTSDDKGFSIAVNTIGNVSTTGRFKFTADFDPGTGVYNLTSGYYDIFVSTLDASGNFLWAKQFGGATNVAAGSITVDATGNVYTTGNFDGTADFDPGTGTYNLTDNGGDIFVSKLDPSGNFVWAIQLGGVSGGGSGHSIAVDVNGNVYTTGSFVGTADFNPSPLGTYNLTDNGQGDVFVSKLGANGDFVWAKNMGGPFPDVGYSIALDANGNVYTTGIFWKAADFDPGNQNYPLTAAGNTSYDIFVSKLDASGNFVWAGRMGGSFEDYGNSIAVDANENVYTTGHFFFTTDFDPGNGVYNLISGNNSNNTYSDIFVEKLCQLSVPTITGTPSFCQGGSTTLTSSPANFYLWSNGATTQSIPVTISGNYSVTVSSASGCSAASTITTVISIPVPTVTVNSPTICAGQSATLTAGGAATYQWSNGMTGSSINVSPNVTTTYSVTGTTAGCASTASAQVTVINLSVDLGADTIIIQQGQQAVLNAGVQPGLTYMWSTGEVTPTIIVTDAGIYTVIASSAGCTVTDFVVVVVITSTADPDNKYKITVSPNPTQSTLNIRCEGGSTTSVQVFDNLGRLILEDKSFAPDGATRTLFLGKVPSGTYQVKIAGDGFVRIVPVVKN